MSEPFVIDDDDRYSRFRLIAWWDQRRLADAKIMVVGAGALGNEVLKNLALLGVGCVYIVDFDKIEHSNLTRSVLFRARDRGRLKAEAAASALVDINPDMRAVPMPCNVMTEVGLGLFRDVDVVIGCLDNREARLWVNRCCWKTTTPWIDGGIQEINGVVKVFTPPDSSCYECAMTEMDYQLINLRYSCPLLRQEDIQAGKVPTAPTISSVIGGMQTQEALKLVHEMPVSAGHTMVFNGQANQFYSTAIQRREDCLSHDTYPEAIELSLSASNTAAELFAAAKEHFDGAEAPMQMSLDRDLVVSLDCSACGNSESVLKPLAAVGTSQANCPACGEMVRPNLEHEVAEDSALASKPMSSLGIPPYDMVPVECGEQGAVFLLAGDREIAGR